MIKRIGCLVIIFFMFFVTIKNVYAKNLTIDEVSKEFNTSSIVEGLKALGSNISSKVNTGDNTLEIYSDSEKVFSFNYSTDYIEYNNRSASVTKESVEDDIATAIWLQGIIESILKLSGYTDKTLSEEVVLNNYDSYGVEMETEHYEYKGEDEGNSWNTSGEFIKYFKMSLDTTKIDALINNFGVDINKQDPNKEVIQSLTPTLRAENITENSVTLYPHLDYQNTDPSDAITCYLYRSENENGPYEKISDFSVNCTEYSFGMVDNNLKSNTTYYYKALAEGGINFSEPIKITTKGVEQVNLNVNVSNNNELENPETGAVFPIITISVMLGISIIILKMARKKSVINKI